MFENLTPPQEGKRIEKRGSEMIVPDHPVIPVIEGDGIGRDIMKAARYVLDSAVEKSYPGKKKLAWFEIYAGEKSHEKFGNWLPDDTLKAIKYYKVALKGPLTTPVGGGFRSLNVTLRQELDLYACVRPVRYFKGTPAPVTHPEKMNVVIFRENTEDVYAGIEWERGSPEANRVISYLNETFKLELRNDSGIGIKPISEFGSKRLVRMAIKYAISHNRSSVTLVHKGNIMKYTEGAFMEWGYELAKDEFGDKVVFESDLGSEVPPGKIVIKDRIADSMFQQILTRTGDYDVIATPNLNGDYLSDACAAQVGGIGMAPGGNIGDEAALFEATHGTAPKYADKDMANPSSLILSGVMMLEHLGWQEAATLTVKGLEKAISQKRVTYDLERLMDGAAKLSTSNFAKVIVENMDW